jgi:hypothetical protein
MGGEMLVELAAVMVGMVGVGLTWMQLKHSREESRRNNSSFPSTSVAPAQTSEATESAPSSASLPVTRSQTAGLEAALAVARTLDSAYARDIKRCEVFEEAIRRKEYQLAMEVVEDFENQYDKNRCREEIASKVMSIKDPKVAQEVQTRLQVGNRR